MKKEVYQEKIDYISQVKMNSVSLIIIQLLMFITYTVKIVSESFETNVTYNISDNEMLDFGILLLLISIILLVFALMPRIASLDLTDEKKVKRFLIYCKLHQLLYVIGYYLMAFGVYFIVVMILVSIGLIPLLFQGFLIVLLSFLVFSLIRSIADIMFS